MILATIILIILTILIILLVVALIVVATKIISFGLTCFRDGDMFDFFLSLLWVLTTIIEMVYFYNH